jgi:hypothetical protein
MFSFLCTFYQVPPSFLDFVFPFGLREHAQDFHFSGLRDESLLASYDRACVLPELDRSGKYIRFCYNLRSVEPSQSQSKLPWSIRQCAVYHTFDVENGRTSWIIVKGNKDIKNRVTETSKRQMHGEGSLNSRGDAFAASLDTHLLLCNWSGENWRWYINDLEDQLQTLTRGVLAFQVERTPTPLSSPSPLNTTSPHPNMGPFCNVSQMSPTSPPSRSFTLPPVWTKRSPNRSNTMQSSPHPYTQSPMGNVDDSLWTSVPTMNSPPKTRRWNSALNDFRSSLKRPWRLDTTNDNPISGDEKRLLPSSERLSPPELPPSFSSSDLDKTPDIFTFRNLQDIQHIEEKAQEAMLVLKLNTDVLEQLRLQYEELTKHEEFPQEVRDDCRASLHHFCKGVVGVEKDLRMLQSRTETLLHLLANRKTLVSTILSNSILNIGNFLVNTQARPMKSTRKAAAISSNAATKHFPKNEQQERQHYSIDIH